MRRATSTPNPTSWVIGAGRAGRAVASRVRAAGLEVVLVDRVDAGGLVDASSVDHPATGVFGLYAIDGLVAAMTRGTPEILRTFAPRHVVLATGATEPMLPFENNDLPGVVAAGGLISLLDRTSMSPAGEVVVVGDGPEAQSAAQRLGAQAVGLQDIIAVRGGSQVESVEIRGRRLDCSIVAVAPSPAPASDLARQAASRVRFNGSGFEVVRDEVGRVEAEGPWQLWAAGQVAGVPAAQSAADGHLVGESIATASPPQRGGSQ